MGMYNYLTVRMELPVTPPGYDPDGDTWQTKGLGSLELHSFRIEDDGKVKRYSVREHEYLEDPFVPDGPFTFYGGWTDGLVRHSWVEYEGVIQDGVCVGIELIEHELQRKGWKDDKWRTVSHYTREKADEQKED